MATFGSFSLLVALALAAYNLIAGAIALRLIATGQPARISPERLADTTRRAGIAGGDSPLRKEQVLRLSRVLRGSHPRGITAGLSVRSAAAPTRGPR